MIGLWKSGLAWYNHSGFLWGFSVLEVTETNVEDAAATHLVQQGYGPDSDRGGQVRIKSFISGNRGETVIYRLEKTQ
jgi:hypothetical protein